MNDGRKLCRLLQLASPMLPIGAYSYSQGLETAVEDGLVTDAQQAEAWIADMFRFSVARFELPLLARLFRDWPDQPDRLYEWNTLLLAGRDTAEARAETLQTGYSLARLLTQLETIIGPDAERLRTMKPVTLPLAYACAARSWGIGEREMLEAYGWSWAENQVAAAMKCVPIGQLAGQRILLAMGELIPALMPLVLNLDDDEICNFTLGLSIVSMRHETQYSRLFRS